MRVKMKISKLLFHLSELFVCVALEEKYALFNASICNLQLIVLFVKR